MSIFDHAEERSPKEYEENLVRSIYKDVDQKKYRFFM